MKRMFFLISGWLSLSLGVIGIFVPVLPTTCFVLLAAYCFSRSSERLYFRLRAHKLFGPLIVDWEDNHVIRLKAKIMATSLLIVMGVLPLALGQMAAWKLGVLVVLVLVLAYIWSFPSGVKTSADSTFRER